MINRILLVVLAVMLGNNFALAAVPGPVAPAFTEPPPGAADKLCASFKDAVPPVADQPTPAQRVALNGCDGEALLYGIGRAADPVQARLCAFKQLNDADAGEPSSLFKGSGLLMTIYANGMGVPRNRPVAVKLACDGVWSAKAEIEFRVPHLAGTLHEPRYDALFSPCDDITSGMTQGVCAAHDARMHQVKVGHDVDLYAATLSVSARAAFAALRKAQAQWSEQRGDGEVDQTGSGRAAFVIDEQQLQNDDFVAMLDRLRHGVPPNLDATRLRAAQVRIDAVLPRLMQQPLQDGIGGTVTADGIRKAQSAWVAYRDTWGRFAALAYPGWGPVGAEAWVSIKRADMLEHLLSDRS